MTTGLEALQANSQTLAVISWILIAACSLSFCFVCVAAGVCLLRIGEHFQTKRISDQQRDEQLFAVARQALKFFDAKRHTEQGQGPTEPKARVS